MNDQDPLAQLRDIHLPDSVGLWPPAPGWWLLAFIIIAAAVYLIVRRYRAVQANRYRAEAVSDLKAAWNQFQTNNDSKQYLLQLCQLLKRTALTAYPAIPINTFHGKRWLVFLDETNPSANLNFIDGPGRHLLDMPYREVVNNVDLKPLHTLSLHWLGRHRQQSAIIKIGLQTYSSSQGAAHVTT